MSIEFLRPEVNELKPRILEKHRSLMLQAEHGDHLQKQAKLELLEHMNDELHRRVVVCQDQHPVEVWSFGLRLDLGDDRRRRAARPSGLLVIAHPGIPRGNERRNSVGS